MESNTRTGAERLIEVAQRLFLTHGYANVSMQAIAVEAGMTKGAPYYHFESKEELFFRVSERVIAQLQARVAVSLDGEGSFEHRLAASFLMVMSTMSGDFSSWINDVKRSLGAERKRCLMESLGTTGDLSDLVLPSFVRARERGEFTRVAPEVAARTYVRLALACIDEASFLQVAGTLTPAWLQQTAAEVASVLVHGIA